MIRISGPFRACAGVWALVCALSAGGCATTRYEAEETPPPVPGPSRSQADTALADTTRTVVPAEIDSLKALLSSQAQKLADLEAIQAELSGKVALLNDRIRALEDRLQASLSPPPPRPARGRSRPAPPPSSATDRQSDATGRVKTLYQAALRDFEARRLESALKAFSEVLATAPKDDLADNAQYWIGECYCGLGKHEQAIKEFQKVFTYSDTEKDDDAQFKIARCFIELGDDDRAVIELKRLTVDYPESEYVRRAEGLLRDLRDHKRQRTK